ncbi:hypothetical protein BT69DRAFT_1364712 [Atractiella rhizophila]|nr:hypothetical protein BT69DRAFT_1364712 [Atractiella rhizophila]
MSISSLKVEIKVTPTFEISVNIQSARSGDSLKRRTKKQNRYELREVNLDSTITESTAMPLVNKVQQVLSETTVIFQSYFPPFTRQLEKMPTEAALNQSINTPTPAHNKSFTKVDTLAMQMLTDGSGLRLDDDDGSKKAILLFLIIVGVILLLVTDGSGLRLDDDDGSKKAILLFLIIVGVILLLIGINWAARLYWIHRKLKEDQGMMAVLPASRREDNVPRAPWNLESDPRQSVMTSEWSKNLKKLRIEVPPQHSSNIRLSFSE